MPSPDKTDKQITLGQGFAMDLCKALGVDPTNVKSIVLRVAVNEPMSLVVEKHVTNIAERRAKTVILRHNFDVTARFASEDLSE